MQRFKNALVALFILISGGLVLAPVAVSADFKGDACSGVNSVQGSNSGTCSSSSAKGITNLIKLVVNILSIMVGFAAIVMIIVGGFKFITSSGDASKISGARSSILYAIIGLVIVALAQVLVHFVLTKSAHAIK